MKLLCLALITLIIIFSYFIVTKCINDDVSKEETNSTQHLDDSALNYTRELYHLYCSSAESSADARDCIWERYDSLLSEINETNNSLLAEIDAGDYLSPNDKKEYKNLLIQSSELWKKYIESHCQYEVYTWRGGTGITGAEAMCMIRLSKQRLDVLQELTGW